MNKIFLKLLFTGIFAFVLNISANAQNQKSTTEKVLNTAGKATVIIVGETAKASYEVAKFGVKTIGKPLIVKVVPKTTKFLLKKSVPVAKKLFVTYLKTRLSL